MDIFMSGLPNLAKRSYFEEALGRWSVVQVHFLDHPDLRVPSPCRPANRLIAVGSEQAIGMMPVLFEYGLDLPIPIPDLKITDAGIEATLSFSREPHSTFVPWDAVVKIGKKFEEGQQESIAPGVPTRPKLKLVP